MSKQIISPSRFNIEVEQVLNVLNQMFHPTPEVNVVADWIAVKYGYKNKQHYLENAKKFNNENYVWYLSPMQPYAFNPEPVSDSIREWFLKTEKALIVHNDAVAQKDIDPIVLMIGVITEMMGQIDDALSAKESLQHIWSVKPTSSYTWTRDWLEKVVLVQVPDVEKRERTSSFLLRDAQEIKNIDLNELNQEKVASLIDELCQYAPSNAPTLRVKVYSDEDAEKLYPILLSSSITDARWLVELMEDKLSPEVSKNLLSLVDRIVSLG